VVPAYTALAAAMVAVLAALAEQEQALRAQVEVGFGQHPDAEIYLSQPGLGPVLAARVLAEFGDAAGRYADARALNGP
jgi:transposase